ncbi:MAG: rhomboid family intramembrane serine protease [Gammaproteobacteria bacterium]|nr:rhomboid family intramembrane serine protease [Gammaproteobacteria bacterium]
MVEVSAAEGSAGEPHPLLDVCLECRFVWFDRDEFRQMPSLPEDAEALPPIDAGADESMAAAAAALAAEQDRAFGGKSPAEWWKWLPGIMGMPIEHNAPKLRSQPLITWGLAAVMAAVMIFTSFTYGYGNFETVFDEYSLVPAQWDRLNGFTFLTSFFLHATLLHLAGNVYFLLVFGDNVEDYLGRWRYLLLIIVATIVGDLAHILLEPSSTVSCVGASGGISGVITYYALRFPRARLGIMLRFWILFKWLHMPAYFALLLWFALQLYGAWAQYNELSGVSSLAHLGGAAVGLLAWAIWRDS